MKTHAIESLLCAHELSLRETVKPVWTGGITTVVRYAVLDGNQQVLAEEWFSFNRSPAYHVKQGSRARRGTGRHEALDRLLAATRARLGLPPQAPSQPPCD